MIENHFWKPRPEAGNWKQLTGSKKQKYAGEQIRKNTQKFKCNVTTCVKITIKQGSRGEESQERRMDSCESLSLG